MRAALPYRASSDAQEQPGVLAGTHFGGCGWRKLSADATPAMVRIIIPASRRLMSRRTCPSKSHYRPPETPRPHSVQTDTRTSVIEIVLPGMLCTVVGRRPKVSRSRSGLHAERGLIDFQPFDNSRPRLGLGALRRHRCTLTPHSPAAPCTFIGSFRIITSTERWREPRGSSTARRSL